MSAAKWVETKIQGLEKEMDGSDTLDKKRDVANDYSLLLQGASEILTSLNQKNDVVEQGKDYVDSTLENLEKRIKLQKSFKV